MATTVPLSPCPRAPIGFSVTRINPILPGVPFEAGLNKRRDIVAGRIVRRVVHGQPYWTAVA
jgi:hypothetical protein